MRRPIAVLNADFYTGEGVVFDRALLIDGDSIVGLVPPLEVPTSAVPVDAKGACIAPAFIDLAPRPTFGEKPEELLGNLSRSGVGGWTSDAALNGTSAGGGQVAAVRRQVPVDVRGHAAALLDVRAIASNPAERARARAADPDARWVLALDGRTADSMDDAAVGTFVRAVATYVDGPAHELCRDGECAGPLVGIIVDPAFLFRRSSAFTALKRSLRASAVGFASGQPGARANRSATNGVAPMIDAVRWCVQVCGVPLDEAFRMATCYPARLAGLHSGSGLLSAGSPADLVACSNQFDVAWVMRGGHLVSAADEAVLHHLRDPASPP